MVVRRPSARRGTPADLVVLGLGNPGDDYAETRHNVGVWVVDELAQRHGARLTRGKREDSRSAEIRIGERRLVIAVPTTFYNEAGKAAGALTRRHGIDDLSRLVVVHDELDLPVGRMKVKSGGGLAGNNGLKSVRAHLRSDDFSRIRLGVGKPESGTMRGADYVLRRPARRERPELETIVRTAADAVEFFVDHDVEDTMNRFNAG